MELILASGSARRRELMALCGYEFTVCASSASEDARADSPRALVEALSLKKAASVWESLPCARRSGAVVIGSDTVVTLDGAVLGKPLDAADAARMLRMESGRENVVVTGLALVFDDGGRMTSRVLSDAARVRFSTLDEDEISAYVATGDPLDKAGAYGIQGPFAKHVRGISGSFYTVMGLPVHLLYSELKKLGILPGRA